jgi:hypothetical protein
VTICAAIQRCGTAMKDCNVPPCGRRPYGDVMVGVAAVVPKQTYVPASDDTFPQATLTTSR